MGESSGMQISQKTAQNIVLGMVTGSVILAIGRTFIHPDFIGAMIGISSASILYWAYRNPELLVTKNMEEFGEQYDKSRDMKYLWGFPLFHVLTVSVILYFWLG